MTNAELLAKIKVEIERLENYYTSVEWYVEALLSFLSTLESEKPINPDDAMKELDEKIALVKQSGTWDGVDVDEYMDEVRGRAPEKPINQEDELNGEIKKFIEEYGYERGNDKLLIAIVARHFAEWGYLRAAEKYNEIEYNRQRAEEDTPNDLEEAAREFAKDAYPDKHNLVWMFKRGAKWQKEQMMKEAVEGKIIFLLNGDVAVNIGDTDKYNLGQKVRVIICKKEDEK